ncbi:hypothetical protein [Gymnodinialimonas ceratoperidinii]|uniref:Uncharacterized protein n=1 Tax=Gymnodinialimonas ceratoperidinii TaxID=2856823 RepID=A0A8F6YBL7_9RHOB|nr:hypothetical protein [Gymnodinialimonas ceratoperidinii]QXT40688.1 hypothetical protein KYE46_05490 [Gymnodinialimonas ceratoperidinii]
MRDPSPSFLTRFATREHGTAPVFGVFVGAVVIFLGISIVLIATSDPEEAEPEEVVQVFDDAEFRAANRGRDRATVLAEGPRGYYSAAEIRRRYEIFSNPDEITDRELRDAHRRWARRVADPAYSQPGRARDMVLLLEHAMAFRGLEPHRGF